MVEARAKADTFSGRAKADPERYRPEFWETEYAERGSAAKSLAWGRAALERGLDMTVANVRERLSSLGGVAGVDDLLAHLPAGAGTQTMREAAGELVAKRRAAAALAAHVDNITHRAVAWEHRALLRNEDGKAAMRFVNAMVDESVKLPGEAVKFARRTGSRAQYTRRAVRYHDFPSLMHELGHGIEDLNPNQKRRALAFLNARTSGERKRRLRDLKPASRYRRDEYAKPDDFVDAYIGKIYKNDHTEITSMGLEILAGGNRGWAPMHRWLVDFEHFLFTLGQLAGR
jgi:hypothetical protein